jgi:hypothetical protein
MRRIKPMTDTYKGVTIDSWSRLGSPEHIAVEFAWPISVEATRNGFRVMYGAQLRSELTYEGACREIGKAIMHALYCDAALGDNGGNDA